MSKQSKLSKIDGLAIMKLREILLKKLQVIEAVRDGLVQGCPADAHLLFAIGNLEQVIKNFDAAIG